VQSKAREGEADKEFENSCPEELSKPLAQRASETAAEVKNKVLRVCNKIEPKRATQVVKFNPCHSILRETSPKHMFLISSNTVVVNRIENSKVKTIPSTGTPIKSRGLRYQRSAQIMPSGVVVHKLSCADCRAVKAIQDALIARLKFLCEI
jgi:hypothetical protein